jgi:hypothetical protein
MTTTPTASPELPDLDKLEALARAATPGEWKAMPHGRVVGGPLRHYVNGSAKAQIASFGVTFHEQAPEDEPERQQANADFAAAANPEQVLALIALARRAQPESTGPDALDATRWRALLGSGRIRPLGSAGLNEPMPNNYAHMGLEIWTTGDWSDCSPALAKRLAYDQEVGIDWLTKYADIARAAQLDGGQGETR